MLEIEEAVALAEALVEEKGSDFVYQPPTPNTGRCYNWHLDSDTPGCIVGQILYRHGVSKELLLHFNNSAAESWLPGQPPIASSTAISFLTVLQNRQDIGWTWGAALEEAKQYARSRGWLEAEPAKQPST